MAAMAASVTLVSANSLGARVLKRSKGQMDQVPAQPEMEEHTKSDASDADKTLTLSVPSIHCQGCVETIEANLRREDGVARVRGDAKTKKIEIAHQSSHTSPDRIESAVSRLRHRVDRVEEHGET